MRLIEYLEHARKLENDIYMCDVTINNLENRITELENERKYKQQLRDSNIQPIKREILKPEIPKGQTKENAIGCLISILCSIFITFPIAVIIGASCLVDLLSLLSYDGDDTVSYKIASDIIMLILSICIALFPIIVRIATSISQKRDYNKRLKEYREECIEAEKEYKNKFAEYHIKAGNLWFNENEYVERISQIKNSIQTIQAIKNDIRISLTYVYSNNVIYPKYRELVPITMFCEYIESGRCDALEGHEGAYNIYENELRQNIIISKLDTIASKLDSIRSSQYLLYTAISDSNRISNQMVESISAYSDQQARANALQELSNKAILDSNRALQDLGQKTLDEIKKFNA